jgi:hypothetical protein
VDDYVIDGDLVFSDQSSALKFYREQYHKKKEWQGLTDEEIREFEIWLDDEEEKHGWNPPADIVKYIEAKLKEKNSA